MLPLITAAISTIAPTLVSADRVSDVDPNLLPPGTPAQAVYNRGQSTFAQTLQKVDPNPAIVEALAEIGRLAKPDTSLDTLIQASAAPATTTPAPGVNLSAVQNAVQAGGQQLRDSARLGINLDTKS